MPWISFSGACRVQPPLASPGIRARPAPVSRVGLLLMQIKLAIQRQSHALSWLSSIGLR
jgi:hypothetical protein